jgi:hypothetical protein
MIYVGAFLWNENNLHYIGNFYILFVLWIIVVVGVQELTKHSDKEEFIRFQKRSKLQFNTKLGCYSPV